MTQFESSDLPLAVLQSPEEKGDPRAVALAVPLRIVHAAMVLGLGIASVMNFAFGVPTTAVATGLGAGACTVAWRIAAAGRIMASAMLTFYLIVAILAVLVLVGHGTRDYALVAIPGVVFAASVFLRPRAYWGLAACVIAGALLLGIAEQSGQFRPRPVPVTGPRELLNLLLIIVASAVGGRGLMFAIRSGLARERTLSGALHDSQERIQKLFRASHNPIVVSRLEDGKYFDVNDAYLLLFGYARDEVIGRTAVELGLWEDAHERVRFVQTMRDRGTVSDYATRMRKRNGEIIEVRFSAELIEVDGESCLLVSVADVTAQREAERRAEYLATRDALTGLPNRAMAIDRLDTGIQRAAATGRAVAIVHFDIDRFKAVNESMGYAAGDALISEVASRIQAVVSPGDTLARVAGNEFLVIAEALERPEEAKAIAERLLEAAFQRPYLIDGRELHVTACAGVSVGPDYAVDAERFLRRADSALHLAKSEGRGTLRLYDEAMSERVRDRLFVEASLREGIARGELRLVYQPKFDLVTSQVTGLEALLRWRHAELGEVSPSTFIPIAEESRLIHELGAWVLGEACGQLARWNAAGLACVPVAVNLSAPQFTPDLPKLVADSARAHGIDPGWIELEVTETMLIKSPETARRVLQQVAVRGSRIVLDDFGVGYSSLGYIKHLDLDGIKIDRSLIRDIAGSRRDAAIVQAILGLAHGLGLRVVGEGVESEAQADALRKLGCDEVQGFHFSRPVSGEEIAAKFLSARSQASRIAG